MISGDGNNRVSGNSFLNMPSGEAKPGLQAANSPVRSWPAVHTPCRKSCLSSWQRGEGVNGL